MMKTNPIESFSEKIAENDEKKRKSAKGRVSEVGD